jgi:hypothetical protein
MRECAFLCNFFCLSFCRDSRSASNFRSISNSDGTPMAAASYVFSHHAGVMIDSDFIISSVCQSHMKSDRDMKFVRFIDKAAVAYHIRVAYSRAYSRVFQVDVSHRNHDPLSARFTCAFIQIYSASLAQGRLWRGVRSITSFRLPFYLEPSFSRFIIDR